MRDAGLSLGRWVGTDDRSGLASLTRVPYLAMGVTNTLAGLLNANGALYGASWGAAATFGANVGLVLARNFVRAGAAREDEGFEVTCGGAWIAAGAASTLVLFAVLGLGIPR